MHSSTTYGHSYPTMHLDSSSNPSLATKADMATPVSRNDSVDTIVLSPNSLSPPRLLLKTIHLNTHINPMDARTTAVCPSSAGSRRSIVQSDGQDDSPSPQHPGFSIPSSQGHPPPTVSSLPATPSSKPPAWSPAASPSRKLHRATSNPALANTAALPVLSPVPVRPRRLSSSPPPSKLQTMGIEPLLRRQGSGADLSPIDECRASECDGKRKLRLEKEARELAMLQAQVRQFFSDGSDDEAAAAADKQERRPAPGDHVTAPPGSSRKDDPAAREKREDDHDKGGEKKGNTGKARTHKLHRCVKLVREKSYGRVFDDPFSAAVALLVLPFCPPLSVYLTFRECGGLNRHRAREVGVTVLLTVLGWVPGVVCEFALSPVCR